MKLLDVIDAYGQLAASARQRSNIGEELRARSNRRQLVDLAYADSGVNPKTGQPEIEYMRSRRVKTR